jgi:hypothetical protein
LKAYARFDGSGRIVAGSLILRRNKPKVGKWKEVPAYECCNPTTTTTTTVAPTTTSTTSVAPTTTTTTTTATPTTTTTSTTASLIVCNLYLNDTGETIANLNYTLCDGTVIEDGSIIDGQSECIQVGTLSGTGSGTLTNLGVCGV